MSVSSTNRENPHPSRWIWVHVGVAALAMAATLPGRTQGLGLFTEPILATTELDRETYGLINLWATLIGGLFCLPAGWLLDRLGTRIVLLGVTFLLATTVVLMSQWSPLTLIPLAIFILFTRGFGQSALSVVSLGLIGRSAGENAGLKMGVYSCGISVLFVAAFGVLSSMIQANPSDWRTPWMGIGIGVFLSGLVGSLLIRNHIVQESEHESSTDASTTFREAIGTRVFWSFALATSFYGMVAAGTSLFNESILGERGFDKGVFLNATIMGIPIGLLANLGGGWLAMKVSLGRMLAVALIVFSGALAAFPHIQSEWQVYAYAMTLAASGGVITVCFFSVWRRTYGPGHLGLIQGSAQFLTVLCSGLGQWLFPAIKDRFTEYAPLFPFLAGMAFALAIFAWLTPGPGRTTRSEMQ